MNKVASASINICVILGRSVAPEVARYIKEEEMFVRPKLTDLPDGGLLFEATVNHGDQFLEWVRKYGPGAEILEPESVRNSFRQELAEWLGFMCI